MSELNGGLDALGTAMLVSSLGGVGAAWLLTPPPQPAKAAAATSNTVINGYFIELYPFVLIRHGPSGWRIGSTCRPHTQDVERARPDRTGGRPPVPLCRCCRL